MQHLPPTTFRCQACGRITSESRYHQERLLQKAPGRHLAFTWGALWRAGGGEESIPPPPSGEGVGTGDSLSGPTGHSGTDPGRQRAWRTFLAPPNPGPGQVGMFSESLCRHCDFPGCIFFLPFLTPGLRLEFSAEHHCSACERGSH